MKASSLEHSTTATDIVRLGFAATFFFVMLWFAVYSWRWPLIWDMQVLHYVSFLMDHGWAPYRQIGDMNMPGAYLFEHWALHVYGSSDLGWRLWDFTLCASLTAGAVVIARPYDWLAGFVAAGGFILVHAAEGPMNAGQRDQVIVTLLIVGTALLFESVRRHRAFSMYFFGFAAALAASVKPTVAVFGPLALLFALLHLRRQGVPYRAYLMWALCGFLTTILIVLGFLIHFQALQTFIHLLLNTLPHYSGINHPVWWKMLFWTIQAPFALFLILVLLARHFNAQRLWNWEQATLVLGICTGVLSYYVQHKGFFQHRYTTTAFVLLWGCIQLVPAVRDRGLAQRFALAALFVLLLNVPRNLRLVRAQESYDYFSSYLEHDLERFGTARLQHKVQCLDIVDGCLNALFHLGIVQSTGATGDLLLFLPESAPAVEQARDSFMEAVQRDPPSLYVVSNWQFGGPIRTFAKLRTWPVFFDYLQTNYVLVQQYEFPFHKKPTSTLGTDPNVPAYRIYMRRGDSLSKPQP